jgi:hypothetical protein
MKNPALDIHVFDYVRPPPWRILFRPTNVDLSAAWKNHVRMAGDGGVSLQQKIDGKNNDNKHRTLLLPPRYPRTTRGNDSFFR